VSRLVFDIETDGLLDTITKIHCIHVYDIDQDKMIHYNPGMVNRGLWKLAQADVLIGHNICGFDIPAIKLLYESWNTDAELIDTLLMGCILYPEDGIKSLKDWQSELKGIKVEHDDWTKYSEQMAIRCREDVVLTHEVYQKLCQCPQSGMINEALAVEQSVAMIHVQQTMVGVKYDVVGALALMKELDEKLEVGRETITRDAPKYTFLPNIPKSRQVAERQYRKIDVDEGFIPKGTVKPYKKDGNYSVATMKYFPGMYENNRKVMVENYRRVRGPYTKIEVRDFNIDSNDEVKKFLLSLGWKPTEWNFKKDKGGGFMKDHNNQLIPTSPKLTEDSYHTLPEGLGKTIAEYYMMTHRRRTIYNVNKQGEKKGALVAVAERGDGRVTADGFTCGTPTSRYRHKGVVCNIPRPSSAYGKQIRSLFCVPEGRLLVGVDLSGIEARMLAHFLLRGKYLSAQKTADLILSPDKTNDFHSYNAKQWGVSRDIAKNGLYALLYGAGAKKLANTLGKDEKMGAKLKKAFFSAHPGIKELIDDLETGLARNGGHVKGIDGRPLYIRGTNKLLNSLLQASAAYVFKKWMVLIAAKKAACLEYSNIQQVIAYHDELQFEVGPADGYLAYYVAVNWASECEGAALDIGKQLGILVPIEAEAKIGENWGDTH